jgi:hypothetical protein
MAALPVSTEIARNPQIFCRDVPGPPRLNAQCPRGMLAAVSPRPVLSDKEEVPGSSPGSPIDRLWLYGAVFCREPLGAAGPWGELILLLPVAVQSRSLGVVPIPPTHGVYEAELLGLPAGLGKPRAMSAAMAIMVRGMPDLEIRTTAHAPGRSRWLWLRVLGLVVLGGVLLLVISLPGLANEDQQSRPGLGLYVVLVLVVAAVTSRTY